MRKEKREHCFLLHTSPILNMLGRLQYFTMDLITGSLMLSEIGLQLSYSTILRLLTILGNKLFRICVVFISLSTISSCSIKVTLSLDTTLSDQNGLMVFQKVLLSVTFFPSRLLSYNFLNFLTRDTQ